MVMLGGLFSIALSSFVLLFLWQNISKLHNIAKSLYCSQRLQIMLKGKNAMFSPKRGLRLYPSDRIMVHTVRVWSMFIVYQTIYSKHNNSMIYVINQQKVTNTNEIDWTFFFTKMINFTKNLSFLYSTYQLNILNCWIINFEL